MESTIGVLRIEQTTVSKEIARFRTCDPVTRSPYCREWAQYIYKKHFVWNAKTQEEVADPNSVITLSVGKYKINLLQAEDIPDLISNTREPSAAVSQHFRNLISQHDSTEQKNLMDEIIDYCRHWITLPSDSCELPDFFGSLEFNPFPDAIPLVDDEKEPSQLLDPLIIERTALCLPSDGFHLLKNLTGDILMSHTTPTCNHTKPESKTPVDLEVDRNIFNGYEQVAVDKALKELAVKLEQAWLPLTDFLDQLSVFEKRYAAIVGKDCQNTINEYFKEQKYTSLPDAWTEKQSQFKKKNATDEQVKDIDMFFEGHMEFLKSCVKDQFLDKFVPSLLSQVKQLISDLWKMALAIDEPISAVDGKTSESLKLLDRDALKKMISALDINQTGKRIVENLTAKVDDYVKEIDAMIGVYHNFNHHNLNSRIEKLNNKDFRKKVKKLESGYYTIRQTLCYEATENIFPEPLFCKLILICLDPLLKEGEVLESMTIKDESNRFIESHFDLIQQRHSLLRQFEEGVQTGRSELAGILGKLFLKEGMRIQGENIALKRQQDLLKSMGVSMPEAGAGKKKNKKTSSGAPTPAVSQGDLTPPAKSEPEKEKVETIAVKKPVKTTKVVDDKISKAGSPRPAAKVESPKPAVKVESLKTAPKIETPKAAPKIETPKPVTKVEAPKVATKTGPPKSVKPIEHTIPGLPPKKKSKSPDSIKKTEKKSEPVAKKKLEPIKSTPPPPVAKVNDDVQDWESIRASVLSTESNSTTVAQEPIQSWSDLRSQVQKEAAESANTTPTTTTTTTATTVASPGGWSTIAAKAPTSASSATVTSPAPAAPATADNWPTVATTTTTTTTTVASTDTPEESDDDTESDDLGGWGAPTISTAFSKPHNNNSGWAESPVALGGWGDNKSSSVPKVVPTPSTSENASSGWSQTDLSAVVPTPTGSDSISKSNDFKSTLSDRNNNSKPAATDTASSKWKDSESVTWRNVNKRPSDWKDSDPSSWEDVKTNPSSSTPWGEKKKSDTATSWRSNPSTKPVAAHHWDARNKEESSGGWDSSKATTINSWNTIEGSGIPNDELPWSNKSAAHAPLVNNNHTLSSPSPSIDSKPPGFDSKPPGFDIKPPGFDNKPPGFDIKPPGFDSNPPALVATPPVLAQHQPLLATQPPFQSPVSPSSGIPSLSRSFLGNSIPITPQLQEPLPLNLVEMKPDMLQLIIRNLHRENGALIQSTVALQQEMNLMNYRYTEIMGLSKEREQQTMQLFETRKQNEMEEMRRYTVQLESRIQQLEETAVERKTTGFGNQDLFAGYREEMRGGGGSRQGGQRKMWQKHNGTVRCGNCAETGHNSSECKSICRYCDSTDHLSEACPMN